MKKTKLVQAMKVFVRSANAYFGGINRLTNAM